VATGKLQNHPEVLPDQAVVSVTINGGIAYLAGDTYGGGSVTPKRTTAQVAAFDLRTRKVLWRIEPLPAQPSLQHIEVHDSVLYGVYKRISGTWFALDLADGTVRHQGRLSGYGEIVTHRGTVYAATNFGDDIAVIGPDVAEARVLYDGLTASWFTVPQLEFEPDSWRAWGAADASWRGSTSAHGPSGTYRPTGPAELGVARADLASHPGGHIALGQQRDRLIGNLGRHQREHPDPAVPGVLPLARLDPAELSEHGEHGRRRPG
jgi:hypothetical protein